MMTLHLAVSRCELKTRENTSIHCWEDLACESSLRNPAVNTESKKAVQGRQPNLHVVRIKSPAASAHVAQQESLFFQPARICDESLTPHSKPTVLQAENPHPSLGQYLVRRVYAFVTSGWNHTHVWLICSSHSSLASTYGDAYTHPGQPLSSFSEPCHLLGASCHICPFPNKHTYLSTESRVSICFCDKLATCLHLSSLVKT